MSSLFVKFRCPWCEQDREGIPYGGVGETICHECWWEMAESERQQREYADAMREAFGVKCGTCHPELMEAQG